MQRHGGAAPLGAMAATRDAVLLDLPPDVLQLIVVAVVAAGDSDPLALARVCKQLRASVSNATTGVCLSSRLVVLELAAAGGVTHEVPVTAWGDSLAHLLQRAHHLRNVTVGEDERQCLQFLSFLSYDSLRNGTARWRLRM